MKCIIGIRREDKNVWEARVPITPAHVKELIQKYNIQVILQPSPIRIFKDQEYRRAGAEISDELHRADMVFAVKEIPPQKLQKEKTYVFFSHTIKGQAVNMPMLKKLMELKCNLIDYEKITDHHGRRLIFFGRHAGLAGMIDTLRFLGKRLDYEGIKNPFSSLLPTYEYKSLACVQEALLKIGEKIKTRGLDKSITPLTVGLAGYGNVSRGAQEILSLLPITEITPDELLILKERNQISCKKIYQVVFREEDMVEPIDEKNSFQLQDYYSYPEKYRSCFEKYLPHLTVLVNAIYWTERYPRLVTRGYMKKIHKEGQKLPLRIVGDISVDVEGAVEFTMKSTDSGNPVFIYNPATDDISDGYEGDGIVVLAVDNLPCEIARESSEHFSDSLIPYIPRMVGADYSLPFEQLDIPPEIKRAMILYHGELTPPFKYMEDFIK